MIDKKDVLINMINSLSESFAVERKKKEPYKELFKSGSTYSGLLMNLEHQMLTHVLDACEIIEQRHGVKVNDEQYKMLLSLPLLAQLAEIDAKREGVSCSIDRAFFMLSENFKESGEVKLID